MAAITNPFLPEDLRDKSGSDYIATAIPVLIGFAFVIATLLFTAMILIGGIRWISSSGDKEAVSSARSTLMNAIVGIIITFSIFAILKLIQTLFGVDIIKIDLGPLKIR